VLAKQALADHSQYNIVLFLTQAEIGNYGYKQIETIDYSSIRLILQIGLENSRYNSSWVRVRENVEFICF